MRALYLTIAFLFLWAGCSRRESARAHPVGFNAADVIIFEGQSDAAVVQRRGMERNQLGSIMNLPRAKSEVWEILEQWLLTRRRSREVSI